MIRITVNMEHFADFVPTYIARRTKLKDVSKGNLSNTKKKMSTVNLARCDDFSVVLGDSSHVHSLFAIGVFALILSNPEKTRYEKEN